MPIPAIIAGGAAIAGGAIAASGARQAAKKQSSAANTALRQQQEAAQEQQRRIDEAVNRKIAATQNIKFPTFLSGESGRQFSQTIQDRISGRGLIDVSAQTAPVAAQRRAGLQRTEAAIGSAASARGLGRSSVAVSQLGAASQAAERDIAERVQQLELQRQGQIERAVTQSGLIAEQESKGQQLKAQFERGGEFEIADTQINAAQTFKNNEFAIAEAIRTQGALEAAFQLQQAEILASGLVGGASGANQAIQTQKILDALDRIDSGQNATTAGQVARSTVPPGGVLNPEIGQNLGGF